MFKRIEFVLDTVGAVAVVLLCLLITANIVAREVLLVGIPDSMIMVRELMVPAILFPLSAATAKRAHVAIEFIANQFPDGLNRWIAVLAAAIGLIVVTTLLVAGWFEFSKNFASGAHYGGEFQIPKWPSRALFVLAIGTFWLRLFQVLWVDLRAAVAGTPAPAEL
jgi:TRAP-type C4-dicarboxylate transport system permease small subunit